MKKWTIEFNTTEAGHVPVRDFIDDMSVKAQAKTYHTLELIADFGPHVGEPHVKYLDRGLWEARISAMDGEYRILFTELKGRVIILLHAFHKKSQKTPVRDIRTARARMRDLK